MRLAFVQCSDRSYSDTQMFGIHFMPVWAYTLAAHVADIEGVELSLFDNRVQDEEQLDSARFDIFLFTGINQDIEAIEKLSRRLRASHPGAVQVIGGPICRSFETAGRLERLIGFDHIFIGDGEELLPAFLRDRLRGAACPKIMRAERRFDLSLARPMHRGLLEKTVKNYYGAIVEVSRGCPFLCEFCDIRTLPDNNRSHVKPAELIVEELDSLWRLGVRQVLFACDNFIGQHSWAEEVCDRIHEWRMSTGCRISLYTWLTIDVSRHAGLLRKLRLAGFDMFFIGVESFNGASLQETAKVQNVSLSLSDALRMIQSYGFIVVAGLIMGFDTDPENIIDIMLEGILKSGLISGDPSLLTALPGTPLYRRMKLSGRLRDGKLGLGGHKYRTNIRYFRPASRISSDFCAFVRRFNEGRYQFKRISMFYSCLSSPNYLPPASAGYADLPRMLALVFRKPRYLWLLIRRVSALLGSPSRVWYIGRAAAMTFARSTAEKPLWFFFKFWLFNWSNSLLKYSALTAADFDIDSIAPGFRKADLIPEGYEEIVDEPIPQSKSRAQRKATIEALKRFIALREVK